MPGKAQGLKESRIQEDQQQEFLSEVKRLAGKVQPEFKGSKKKIQQKAESWGRACLRSAGPWEGVCYASGSSN